MVGTHSIEGNINFLYNIIINFFYNHRNQSWWLGENNSCLNQKIVDSWIYYHLVTILQTQLRMLDLIQSHKFSFCLLIFTHSCIHFHRMAQWKQRITRFQTMIPINKVIKKSIAKFPECTQQKQNPLPIYSITVRWKQNAKTGYFHPSSLS